MKVEVGLAFTGARVVRMKRRRRGTTLVVNMIGGAGR